MADFEGFNLDPGNARLFTEVFEGSFAGGGQDPGGLASLKPEDISSIASEVSSIDVTKLDLPTDIPDVASIRVAFLSETNPYLPYENFYASVQRMDNGTKVFVGQFTFPFDEPYLDDPNVAPTADEEQPVDIPAINLINIPLIGQSIEDLVDSLNVVEGIRAEVVGNAHLEDASLLRTTSFYDGTDRWAFFFTDEPAADTNSTGVTSTLGRDVKFYLTSVEPRIEQNNPTQSLGGFISPTELYKTDVLAESISFYNTTLSTEGTNLTEASLIQIQDEIIRVDNWQDNLAGLSERNVFGTPLRFHPQGAVVREIGQNDIFDSKFSRSRTQYRCIAIRNESDTEFLKNVKVYFNLLTRNSFSNTRIAVELPRSDYRASTASGGGDNYLVDTTLEGLFGDEHYTTSSVTFTSGGNAGQTRIVDNYNGSTGTLFFSERLPAVVQNGDAYYVDTSPSQRIPVGTESPSTVASVATPPVPPFRISSFQDALFFVNGVDINVDSSRSSGNTLRPWEAIYVWIERRLEDNNQSFEGNRSFVTIGYSRV